jgi:hypothetical protein
MMVWLLAGTSHAQQQDQVTYGPPRVNHGIRCGLWLFALISCPAVCSSRVVVMATMVDRRCRVQRLHRMC